jgi:hypothetical protein
LFAQAFLAFYFEIPPSLQSSEVSDEFESSELSEQSELSNFSEPSVALDVPDVLEASRLSGLPNSPDSFYFPGFSISCKVSGSLESSEPVDSFESSSSEELELSSLALELFWTSLSYIISLAGPRRGLHHTGHTKPQTQAFPNPDHDFLAGELCWSLDRFLTFSYHY